MAYIIQRTGTPYWTAQWRGPDGKKKKRSTQVRIKPDFKLDGIRETPSQARARAQQIADTFERADSGRITAQKLHSTINALLPAGGVPTIRDYVSSYIAGRKARAQKTQNNDSSAFDSFLRYLGEAANNTIDTLTTSQVNAWLESECERIRPSTLRLYRSSVHSAFRRAYEEELICRDPFARSRLPKIVDPAPIVRKSFELEMLQKLIGSLSPEWSMAVRLCVFLGGLRLGDTCNLRWDQFDFKLGTCELVTRKRGIPMTIPLIPSLVRHLQAWPRDGAHILPTLHARYNSPSRTTLSTEFTSMVRGLGLGKMTGQSGGQRGRRGMTDRSFHMLRSTAATFLQLAGVNEAIAMKVLSHNSAAVHQVYIRPSDKAIREEMQHLDIDL